MESEALKTNSLDKFKYAYNQLLLTNQRDKSIQMTIQIQ